MVGLIVTAKNEMRQVDYDAPHYDIIQKAVGGWYEHVHPIGLEWPYCMMVNEEGLMMNLPLNLIGSILYATPSMARPSWAMLSFSKMATTAENLMWSE